MLQFEKTLEDAAEHFKEEILQEKYQGFNEDPQMIHLPKKN